MTNLTQMLEESRLRPSANDPPFGTHAGFDGDDRELVYTSFGMKMHKDVFDRINAEWDRVFGDGK